MHLREDRVILRHLSDIAIGETVSVVSDESGDHIGIVLEVVSCRQRETRRCIGLRNVACRRKGGVGVEKKASLPPFNPRPCPVAELRRRRWCQSRMICFEIKVPVPEAPLPEQDSGDRAESFLLGNESTSIWGFTAH